MIVASKYKKTGRKPSKDPAIYRYNFKLNSIENDKFMLLFEQSGIKEKSKFIKALLFNHTLKVVKIDRSTEDFYLKLTNLYNQYRAIGVNYNQIVKALKGNFAEKRTIVMLAKLETATTELIKITRFVVDLTLHLKEHNDKQW